MTDTPPPIHPRDRYPRRSFAVTLGELPGWPEKRVLAELGRPNSKTLMERAPRPSDGNFGPPAPKNFPADAPYEMWFPHNVEGNTWVLYMAHKQRVPVVEPQPFEMETPAGSDEREPSETPRRGLWQRLIGVFWRCRLTTSVLRGKRLRRRLHGPRVVVDVWCYPTGAVF